MRVLAFHTPLSKELFPYHEQLIEFWHQTWGEMGWETVLLGMPDAMKHPDFERFSETVKKFPTINPEGFEHASWVRWLAFEQAGAGFISDYDCINLNHPAPTGLPERSCSYAYEYPSFEGTPSFVYLTRQDLQKFLVRMETEGLSVIEHPIPDRDHTSDMVFFNNLCRKGELPFHPRLVQHSYEQPICHPIVHITRVSSDVYEKLGIAESILKHHS